MQHRPKLSRLSSSPRVRAHAALREQRPRRRSPSAASKGFGPWSSCIPALLCAAPSARMFGGPETGFEQLDCGHADSRDKKNPSRPVARGAAAVPAGADRSIARWQRGKPQSLDKRARRWRAGRSPQVRQGAMLRSRSPFGCGAKGGLLPTGMVSAPSEVHDERFGPSTQRSVTQVRANDARVQRSPYPR